MEPLAGRSHRPPLAPLPPALRPQLHLHRRLLRLHGGDRGQQAGVSAAAGRLPLPRSPGHLRPPVSRHPRHPGSAHPAPARPRPAVLPSHTRSAEAEQLCDGAAAWLWGGTGPAAPPPPAPALHLLSSCQPAACQVTLITTDCLNLLWKFLHHKTEPLCSFQLKLYICIQ